MEIEDYIKICAGLPTFEELGEYANAIVIRDGNQLLSFIRKNNSYEQVTYQSSTNHKPQTHKATEDIFVKNCIPDVLGKTGFASKVALAFIDMQADWEHDELLCHWADYQNQINLIASAVYMQTYSGRQTDTPVLRSKRNWIRGSSNGSSSHDAPFSSHDLSDAHDLLAGMQGKPILIDRSSGTIKIGLINDVPAEFDQVVWRVTKFSSKTNSMRFRIERDKHWDNVAMQEKCLTTLEITNFLYVKPKLEDLVNTFRVLRLAEGQWAKVPMVGFDRRWLWTKSHLSPFNAVADVLLEIEELADFATRRYISTAIRKTHYSRIVTAANRCLAHSTKGLRLFDLTEDIIFTLIGRVDTRLSLGDAYRVYDALNFRGYSE